MLGKLQTNINFNIKQNQSLRRNPTFGAISADEFAKLAELVERGSNPLVTARMNTRMNMYELSAPNHTDAIYHSFEAIVLEIKGGMVKLIAPWLEHRNLIASSPGRNSISGDVNTSMDTMLVAKDQFMRHYSIVPNKVIKLS